MNALHARTAALAALLLATSAAWAHAETPSPVDAAADPVSVSLVRDTAPSFALVTAPEASLELTHVVVPDEQWLGVHYRPRSSNTHGHMDSQSVTQIHLGFYDPEGSPGRQFLMGLRGGPMLDPHVQLGVGLDWSHIADNSSSVTHQTPGPNGTTLTVTQDFSRASTDMFPIMAFAQFSGDDNMSLIPFFGIAGGYEFLNLSADNYVTQTSFDATYGGWGWQIWGGGAIPLSGRVRVGAEIYLNTVEPGRDVSSINGVTYRESVKADGSGLRIGMAWGF